MASKKARAFLRSLGVTLPARAGATERGNYSAGRGLGRFGASLPYQLVRFDANTGDSTATVGYAATVAEARAKIAEFRSADNRSARYGWAIRDIRTNRYCR